MKIEGHKLIEARPEEAYRLLTDPSVLVRTMPGLKALVPDGEGSYAAEMEMGVASIKGKYQGRMEIVDQIVAQSYRLVMNGQGPGGFVTVSMQVAFDPQEQGTEVTYAGEAQVGGTVAGVGQRMLSGVASYIVKQFFAAIAKEAAAENKEA
jgi:carbon monoxide dehydrogenase subunit G